MLVVLRSAWAGERETEPGSESLTQLLLPKKKSTTTSAKSKREVTSEIRNP